MISDQIKKFIIFENESLKNALIKLNKFGKRVLFVCKKNKTVLGSLSDGDIRKALIKKDNLEQNIKYVFNKRFIFIKSKKEIKKKIKMIKKNNIIYIPLCDRKKKLIDIIDLNSFHISSKIKSPFIILAGGRGRRMMPLTLNKPKPLLRVKNKPILEHIILKAKDQGFEKFIISLGYKGNKIKSYFKNGKRLGVKIDYVTEKKPLGTAGFLGLLKNLKDKNFFIVNGDIITKANLFEMLQFHLKNKSLATMAIKKKLNNEKLGVVQSNGSKFIKVDEKPLITYNINSGIYILNKKILNYIKTNQRLEMTDLFNYLKSKNKKLYVFPIYESWIDLANSSDLNEAKQFLK